MSVAYDDWKGGEWLPNGGCRCRHVPTGCVFDCWIDPHREERAELREGNATPELFGLAKGYYRVFGHVNPDLQPPGGFAAMTEAIASYKPCITAEQIAELERDIQDGMPEGWRIRALVERHGDHHQLTGYELQVGFDLFTISIEGAKELPSGWTIKRIGGAFYDEFIITAPDGTDALISAILLA